jgi:hypothetical protein
LAFIVTVQLPVPEHAPLQPEKTSFAPACAVSVTTVPLLKALLQVVPQLTPAGLLVTTPFWLPLPPLVTVSVYLVVVVPVIVNGKAFDTDAPGFRTVTWTVPAVAMSAAGTAADSWVLLTKVVVRFAPFQRTVAPDRKSVPFTFSVKAGPPALALFGESAVSVAGAGAGGGGAPDAPSCTMLPMDGTPLLLTRKSR